MNDFKTLFDRGQDHFSGQRWEPARDAFAAALAAKPGDADTLMNLGSCQFMTKDYAGCVESCEAYERAAGPHEGVLFTLGMALHHLRRFDGAIGVFNRILNGDPMHNRAAFQIGMSERARGDGDAACEAFRLSLQLNAMRSGVLPDSYDRRTDVLALYNIVDLSVAAGEWAEVEHKVALLCEEYEEPEAPFDIATHLEDAAAKRRLLEIIAEKAPAFEPAEAALESMRAAGS